MARFGAVITAMVTPFAADGSLDTAAAGALARWLVEHGNDALVLAGTTGESAVLTDRSRVELFRSVRATVDVPAHRRLHHQRHPPRLASSPAAATDAGMDAVLVVMPYYNRPPQSGLEAHFRHVADATDLPVILYDIPVRTGRALATQPILRLASRRCPTSSRSRTPVATPASPPGGSPRPPRGSRSTPVDDPLTLPLPPSAPSA